MGGKRSLRYVPGAGHCWSQHRHSKAINLTPSSLNRLSQMLDEGRFEEVANEDPPANDEETPRFWAYQGYANWKLSRYPLAIQAFSIALQMQPDARNTLFLRGRCFEELRNYPEAISDYETVLSLAPQTADAHAHLGFCHEQLGNLGRAWQEYATALQIDPQETLALAGVKSLRPGQGTT